MTTSDLNQYASYNLLGNVQIRHSCNVWLLIFRSNSESKPSIFLSFYIVKGQWEYHHIWEVRIYLPCAGLNQRCMLESPQTDILVYRSCRWIENIWIISYCKIIILSRFLDFKEDVGLRRLLHFMICTELQELIHMRTAKITRTLIFFMNSIWGQCFLKVMANKFSLYGRWRG